jgi:hypothetical protein
MMTQSDCSVCGESADENMLAVCSHCDKAFHLNPRNDVPGKDCGAVWINEQYLGLEYACQRCLDGQEEVRSPEPRILRPQLGRRRYRKRT